MMTNSFKAALNSAREALTRKWIVSVGDNATDVAGVSHVERIFSTRAYWYAVVHYEDYAANKSGFYLFVRMDGKWLRYDRLVGVYNVPQAWEAAKRIAK